MGETKLIRLCENKCDSRQQNQSYGSFLIEIYLTAPFKW